MKAVPALCLIAPLALMLGGCDWIAGAGSSSDTKMTNVEILPGTASDEMITLDQASGDGTAIDTSLAVRPGEPGRADDADKPEGDGDAADGDAAPDDPAASDDAPAPADAPDDSDRPDVVIRPPSDSTKR